MSDTAFVTSLEATLKQITLPDTAAVKQATTKLSKEFYPDAKSLPAMIQILQSHPEELIRQLAAIEAKKLVIRHYESLDEATQQSIRSSILQSTLNEQNKKVAHNSARVISTISELDAKEWPELLSVLVSNAESTDSRVKETSIYTLYCLWETYPEAFADHINDFLTLFVKTLADQSSIDVQVYSLLALVTIAGYVDALIENNDAIANQFQSLIDPMITVLQTVISKDDFDSAKEVFNAFNDFIYLDMKFLGEKFLVLVKLFSDISLSSIDEEYRKMSIQALIRLVILRKSKIIAKKLGPELTLTGLRLAAEEIDDEEELDETYEENENEENTTSALGLRLLSNLSTELPPSQVIVPLFNQIPQLLESNDKYKSRAGLLSIGTIAAGAPDFLTSYLPKLINFLIHGLNSNEPVVQVASLKSITELTTELQNTLANYHKILLPILMKIIDNSSYAVIFKYATYSLDGIIEYIDHDAIAEYLEPLMNKLIQMLQNANTSVLKSAIVSAIGSTAFASGRAFIPFFDDSLKLLEPLIQMSVDNTGLTEDDIELKASTFENISTMARAVGAAPFAKFAEPLINSAYICIDSDSPRLREAGFTFISNMAKVYGSEFSPFLPKLIPAIIKCLEQSEFNIINDFDEDQDFDADDIDDNFGIHTGITMEKEIACVALGELATATKSDFVHYINDILKVLTDQIEESFSIGAIAIDTIWKIVAALNDSTNKFPVGAVSSSYVAPELLNIIKVARDITLNSLISEYDISFVHPLLINLNDALREIGPIVIMDNGDSSSLEKLCVELMKLLKGEHPCQATELDEEKDDELDASEADVLLFDSSLDVLIALSIALGNDFNRIFASFKDVILKNMQSASKNKRSIVIGGLAEISNALGSNNEYSADLLSVFVEVLANDSYLDVKSNAAYGIGIIIFNSTAPITSAFQNILSSLSKLLAKAENENIDDEETKDMIDRSYANACGCVARMFLKSPELVPVDQILPVLLSHLPLKTAYEEYTPIFNLIIQLYQTNFALIDQYTSSTVEIFAAVFTKEQERLKLEVEATLGREQDLDRMKQFPADGLREQVVELLKFIESKHPGSISGNNVLKNFV